MQKKTQPSSRLAARGARYTLYSCKKRVFARISASKTHVQHVATPAMMPYDPHGTEGSIAQLSERTSEAKRPQSTSTMALTMRDFGIIRLEKKGYHMKGQHARPRQMQVAPLTGSSKP